jgi:hypothetical protein
MEKEVKATKTNIIGADLFHELPHDSRGLLRRILECEYFIVVVVSTRTLIDEIQRHGFQCCLFAGPLGFLYCR